MKYANIFWVCIGFLMTGLPLQAQKETSVVVRVLAKDAKWIGNSMGGVEIAIKDLMTGELLAFGRTVGETGNTDLLVLQDKKRYGTLSTPGSAAFKANLTLHKPVFVEVTATFRSAYSGMPVSASQQRWLIPGKPLSDDGIVIELPGFAMRINHPMPHQTVSLENKEEVRIDLFMIMLCGCPIESGGTWDSDSMEIEAMIYQDEKWIRNIPFTHRSTNHFTADLSTLSIGSYQVFVSAYDPRSGNTGVEKIQVTIRE
ncbi:MAG TPA: hypothetical protein VKZ56_03805 [Membranihabitans sp.]|nr:hypothetical protein [Membranihabitans sp.]